MDYKQAINVSEFSLRYQVKENNGRESAMRLGKIDMNEMER
jgi:hypothetical protein